MVWYVPTSVTFLCYDYICFVDWNRSKVMRGTTRLLMAVNAAAATNNPLSLHDMYRCCVEHACVLSVQLKGKGGGFFFSEKRRGVGTNPTFCCTTQGVYSFTNLN